MDLEPTYPLSILVELEDPDPDLRFRLQEIVDATLGADALGLPWLVRRFFERGDEAAMPRGFYEVTGRIPVSPSYPVRAQGFELAGDLTDALGDTLSGFAMPDFPTTAFGGTLDAGDTDADDGGTAEAATSTSWPLDNMRCPEAWALSPPPGGASRGAGIVVAQPDTGYTVHRELGDALDLNRDYDVVSSDHDAEDPLTKRWWWPLDSPGHGTSTGSSIASRETHAVTGSAPDATLVPIRAIRSVVQVSDGDVAKAIDRAIAIGAHVVSLSLGGVGFYSGIRDAIRRARAAGMIVLAAAGNKVQIVVAPARFKECIAVAATERDDQPWGGSSRGNPVVISAPGHRVPVAKAEKGATPTDPGTRVSRSSGTSYSVAYLAGVAALWLAHHGRDELVQRYGPEGVQAAFERILETEGFTRPDPWDDDWGVGVVDAHKVLSASLPAALPAAVDVRRIDPGDPIARLADLSGVDDDEMRGRLRRSLHCTDDDLEPLARRYCPELAYMQAETEAAETPVLGAVAAPVEEVVAETALCSPSLRTRLRP